MDCAKNTNLTFFQVSTGDPESRIVDVFHSFVRPVINPVSCSVGLNIFKATLPAGMKVSFWQGDI